MGYSNNFKKSYYFAFKFCIYLILLIFNSSCITVTSKHEEIPESAKYKNSDPVFYPYVHKFHKVLGEDYLYLLNENITIMHSVMLDKNTAGTCSVQGRKTIDKTETLTIKINLAKWNEYNKTSKEALMLHELSHCLCGLQHRHYYDSYDSPSEEFEKVKSLKEDMFTEGYFEDKCPTSLMHPIVISEKCFNKHETEYKLELRQRCLKKLKDLEGRK